MAIVTIKQIAERTGLSIRTVGRILSEETSGSGSHLHASATREKVVTAARELGYRPNASARSMRTGRFGCVALLLSSTSPQRSNLPGELFAGIDDALTEHNIHLTLARLPDEKLATEEVLPKILREWMADGLLVNYNYHIPQSLLQTIRDPRIPSVWINTKQEANAVWPDDFAAGRLATEDLIARGHKRIAYAVQEGADGHYSATDRYEGYREAMEAAGLPTEKLLLPEPQVRQGRTSLLPPPGWEENGPVWQPDAVATGKRPTAILAYMSNVAHFLLILAAGQGLQAPRDLSMVTFEDYTSEAAGLLITTWRIPTYRLGQEAVRMLLARLADSDHAPQPPVIVPFAPPDHDSTVGPPPIS
jgi:LacI family transcriptional regulator